MGTWDLKLPSSKRSFLEALAREFVSRVEALGFERVEWWTGREWRKSQGRFHILHDNVYNKYHMRLRVRWTDRLAPEEYVRQDSLAAPQSQSQILEQIQQTLEMQREMLEAALVPSEGHSNSAVEEAALVPSAGHSNTAVEELPKTEVSPVPSTRPDAAMSPAASFFGPWPTAATSPDMLG